MAIRLLEVIGRLARRGAKRRWRQALHEHLERINDACRAQITGQSDLRDIEERYREAAEATH